MKATIGFLAFALLGSPATAWEYKPLTVGAVVTFNDRGDRPLRDYFGCFDKENTLAAFHLWSDRWNGSYVGDAAVNRFVQAHGDLDAELARDERAGRPRPYSSSFFWRNICLPFHPGEEWKVQQVYNWRDPKEPNAQLVCLETTLNFDPGPPRGQKKLPEEYGPFKPFCWWTALFMPPTIVRR
jgi:hypothetical protein